MAIIHEQSGPYVYLAFQSKRRAEIYGSGYKISNGLVDLIEVCKDVFSKL